MSETPHAERIRHAEQLERMLRCLNIPLDQDVEALEAGAAALRQPRPGTWQPIETAPKDGTQIWLWWDGKRRLAHWHEAENPPSIGGRFANWLTDDRGSVSAVTKPRLWCPCPSPPQTETP